MIRRSRLKITCIYLPVKNDSSQNHSFMVTNLFLLFSFVPVPYRTSIICPLQRFLVSEVDDLKVCCFTSNSSAEWQHICSEKTLLLEKYFFLYRSVLWWDSKFLLFHLAFGFVATIIYCKVLSKILWPMGLTVYSMKSVDGCAVCWPHHGSFGSAVVRKALALWT